jgi:hypothetical protein
MKRTAASSFVVATGLVALALAPAFAQERPAPQGQSGGDRAVARPSGGSSSAPSGGSTTSSAPGGGSSVGSSGSHRAVPREGRRGGSGSTGRSGPKSVILPAGPESSSPGDRREPNPSYSRPRAGRPSTGSAVPRDESNVPDLGWRRDPYWAYGYWRYSHWTPLYYGPWGGYMYYDPFWWDYYYGYYPGSYGGHGGYGGYGGGYGGGYSQDYESDYSQGGLKLKVKPRDAQVYVDGYFSGVVDEYDGVFQKLKLRSGAHRLELRAEGFQPSIFDVLIVAGETITYRGELKEKP